MPLAGKLPRTCPFHENNSHLHVAHRSGLGTSGYAGFATVSTTAMLQALFYGFTTMPANTKLITTQTKYDALRGFMVQLHQLPVGPASFAQANALITSFIDEIRKSGDGKTPGVGELRYGFQLDIYVQTQGGLKLAGPGLLVYNARLLRELYR